MLRQVWFHRWGKKKKAQEFRLSLERLDQVVKDMIVPLEF
jgi:archaellum component FlaC